jgi:hypothetical protein
MNETNRSAIVFGAAAWIVLLVLIIFFTWTSSASVVNRLGDFVQYLDEHRTTSGKLIVTLGAIAAAILALLVIVVELAPEEEDRELRVEQAGATTIVPADALRMRLEEALMGLPDVTAARARVSSRDKGIATALDLTLTPGANAANVTQEASRVVIDTIQMDLGLPVSGVPVVRVAFGGTRAGTPPAPVPAPAAAMPENPPPVEEVETVDERVEEPPETSPGASPGPSVFEERPSGPAPAAAAPERAAEVPPLEQAPAEDHGEPH